MSLRTLACSNSRKGHVTGGCLPRQSVVGINFKTTETRVANSIHPRRVFLDESYNDDESLWEKTGAFLGLGSQRDPGHWNLSPEWFGQQGGGWGRNSGDVVFECQSDLNGIVQVTAHSASPVGLEEYAEWRVLRFNGGTRQSVTRLHDQGGVLGMDATCLAAEYLKTVASIFSAWMAIHQSDRDPVKMLAIGIGGGSMPMFLLHFFSSISIDAVEIDPVVIDAAKSSMGFPEQNDRLGLYVQDAAAFAQEHQSKKQYDFVYIDAFDGEDCIPEGLCSDDFIQSVASMMDPEKGVLLMNFHDEDPRAFKTAQRIHHIIHGTSFTVSCRIQKNFILCCSTSDYLSGLTSDEVTRMMKSSASFVSQKKGVPFSMGHRAVADLTLLPQ